MRPSIWILSTGTELSQGRSRDTNSSEIARRLSDQGFNIAGISILPDDPAILLSYMTWLRNRNDIQGWIMTGGLGPTDDDHTVDVLSRLANSAITEDVPSLHRLEAFARLRRRIDVATARRQIRVLADAEVIPNPTGLAPGIFGSVKREDGSALYFCALPGVPSEMRLMCEEAIRRLREHVDARPVHRIDFHIYEEPESDFQKTVFGTDGLAPATLREDPAFRWGVSAIPGSLKIFLEHETDHGLLRELEHSIRSHYTDRFVERSVDELLPELLIERKLTLALAESCTGGWMAKMLTDRSGSSAYFVGSAVTYSNDAKRHILGVPEELLREHGAVSEPCALAMASAARRRFDARIALSVTGIAGPDGGTPEKPVGTVFVGIDTGERQYAFRLFHPLDRERIREYTCRIALFRMYRILSNG